MKKVTDAYGEVVTVDDTTQNIVGYRNKKKKIWYNAEILKNGKHTGQYINYADKGIVNDYEQRIKASHLNSSYAVMVNYYASKNDPEEKIWNKLVNFVKENESEIFDEYGDVNVIDIVKEENGEFVIKK